ncbi:hypothetical protein NPIL_496491 [Nephila pilipes]|uniref:Uncharacterized protein n=1 Tax=Nephila pilipes TaxID=299642 RepID=A0A8X6URG7_NEPPI|nr:hypothetical protein NPIL_496491 [Nephila pilipes]
MQIFWSLPGYYTKFIANNSETAKSLSDLHIEAELGVFGIKQVESFEKLEKILWTIPMVRFFKHSTPLELHTFVIVLVLLYYKNLKMVSYTPFVS